MTPEEQLAEAVSRLEAEARDLEELGYVKKADRYRCILAALSTLQEPFGWYVQRLSDGTGTLVFREPAHSPGTQAVTPLFARPSPSTDATPE